MRLAKLIPMLLDRLAFAKVLTHFCESLWLTSGLICHNLNFLYPVFKSGDSL